MMPLDLIFVTSTHSSIDVTRLISLLEGQTVFNKVILACPTETLDPGLVSVLKRFNCSWDSIHGPHDTHVVSRALLLSPHDTLIASGQFAAVGDMAIELQRLLENHDRAAAVVASAELSGASTKLIASTIKRATFPSSFPVPVPDVGVALLSHKVMTLIGGLDETIDGLVDALADWALRAQRLGFIVLRSTRAWASALAAGTVAEYPMAARVDASHPHYPAQRRAANADVRRMMPQRAVWAESGMNVCLDVRYLPEDAINGTSVYAIELTRALGRFTPVNVSLCVNSDHQREAMSTLGVPIAVGSISEHTHLVHRPAQVFRPQDLALLLNSRAPFVMTFQDLIAYRAGSAFGDGEAHLAYQRTSWAAVRSAQGLIAISDHNRREVIEEFGVEPGCIRTVYHGVDVTSFERRSDDNDSKHLAPYHLPRRFFFFIGSDYAHKNLMMLLSAYAQFRAKWEGREPTPGLVIVGHPSGTADGLYRKIKDAPLPGVHYLGDVPHETLRALYHRAIAFVYLSAYEGFGLPILEAMAAHTPVVTSRLSSIPEVAGDAARYIDDLSDSNVADVLVELASNAEPPQAMLTKGQERVREFTWKKTALATYAVYQAALLSPSKSSLSERRWLTDLTSR